MPEYGARRLAGQLDEVRTLSPANSMILNLFVRKAERLSAVFPQIAKEQRAFSVARDACPQAGCTEQNWKKLLQAATALAKAIRKLGDV